jgi:hypothetical protein
MKANCITDTIIETLLGHYYKVHDVSVLRNETAYAYFIMKNAIIIEKGA